MQYKYHVVYSAYRYVYCAIGIVCMRIVTSVLLYTW